MKAPAARWDALAVLRDLTVMQMPPNLLAMLLACYRKRWILEL
jgi:hypothetical protein